MHDLEELYNSGKINEYFYNKLKKSVGFNIINEDDVSDYLNDVIQMSVLGVSSQEDELIARRLQYDIPDVINDIIREDYEVSPQEMQDIYFEMYNNRDKYDTSSILDVFCSVAKAANIIGIPLNDSASSSCTMEKAAYPQGYAGSQQKPIYDISRWMQATRDIYSRIQRNGSSYNQAFNEVTGNWDKMEKLDYKHWLRFYSEGVPAKYPKLADKPGGAIKTAQYHSENGFFLPMAQLPEPVKEEEKPKPDINEVRDKIEYQRAKILSRLSAAERLLCSLDGQSFAGDEQEFMLKLLQDLKRKVQVANKISVKSSMFEDFIYRAGNFMKEHRGFKKGASFFYKIAQTSDFTGDIPGATPGAAPGAVPGQTPAAPASFMGDVPMTDGSKEETRQAFKEFFDRLEIGIYDNDDDPEEREKFKQASFDTDEIIVTAQEVQEDIPIGSAETLPQEQRPRQERARLPPEEELTVSEDEIVEEDDTEDVIEAALDNITIDDVINRLEMLVTIYKKRDISRQLNILDLMMDSLGLGSYFPSLGEAMGKSLEANQYIATRIEDVLTKLKGSAESPQANAWIAEQKEEAEENPKTEHIRQDLDAKTNKEKEQKALRKQKENARLEKGKTEVADQAQQELSQPTEVQTAKPVQVR